MNTNDGGKYACSYCDSVYDVKSSLYSHVSKKHKKEKEAAKAAKEGVQVVQEVVDQVVGEVVQDGVEEGQGVGEVQVVEEVQGVEVSEEADRVKVMEALKEVEIGNLIDLEVLLEDEEFVDAVEELEEGLGLHVELETLDNSLLKHWMDQRVEVESLFG